MEGPKDQQIPSLQDHFFSGFYLFKVGGRCEKLKILSNLPMSVMLINSALKVWKTWNGKGKLGWLVCGDSI